MAVGWIQLDKDLEQKPEFLELLAVAGESVETVGWRLIKFWGWVDDFVPEGGRIEKLTLVGMRLKFGGTAEWWECMKRVKWLGEDAQGLYIPSHDQRFTKSAKQRLQHSKRANLARERSKGDRPPRSRAAHGKRTTSATPAQQKRHLDGDGDIDGDKDLSASTSSVAPAASDETLTPPDADAHKGAGRGQDGSSTQAPMAPATWNREINWDSAPTVAKRLVTKLELGKMSQQDYELVLKVAVLAMHRLSEDVIWDSVEAVRQQFCRPPAEQPKTTRCGYWHGTLASKCQDLGENFNQLLAMITIPPEFARPKPRNQEPAGAPP